MRWALGAALVVALTGCSETLAVHVVTQPDTGLLTPRPEDCEARLYVTEERIPPTCREVGDVFLGDTGFTTNCGPDRVWKELQRQTCRFGADAAQVVRTHESSAFGSSCHQVRARFLVCPADTANEEGE